MTCSASPWDPRLRIEPVKVSYAEGLLNGTQSHLTQAFILARTNSVTLRKGTWCSCMTRDASRRRGPSSPAGNTSNSIAGIGSWYLTYNLKNILLLRPRWKRITRNKYLLLHPIRVAVRTSLPASAWRTRRKGCVVPLPSTIQNNSYGGKL